MNFTAKELDNLDRLFKQDHPIQLAHLNNRFFLTVLLAVAIGSALVGSAFAPIGC